MSTGFITLKSQIDKLEEREKELVQEINTIRSLNIRVTTQFNQSIMVLAKEIQDIKKIMRSLNNKFDLTQQNSNNELNSAQTQQNRKNYQKQLRQELKEIFQDIRANFHLISASKETIS